MATVKAPYLPYEKLRAIADSFLREHHPALSLPIPIEKIIEYDLGMDIVPMPGLLSFIGKDGWITPDLSTIYVDEHFYKERENRYRFTLAHELSHRLVHADVLRSMQYSSIDEWKERRTAIPDRELGFIEWQADALGGLILAPAERLEPAFASFANRAFETGVDVHKLDERARRSFDAAIGKEFGVSSKVITIRLGYDGHVSREKRQ